MNFPVAGGSWELSVESMDFLIAAYRRVDVPHELGKAALWLYANPTRQKTAKGMQRFLVGWLNRVDRNLPKPASDTRPLTAWVCPHVPPCIDGATKCSLRTRLGRVNL